MNIILLLLSIIPHNVAIEDNVDKVEWNHYYDENGKKTLDQIIWYEWIAGHSKYKVVAWKLSKHESPTTINPIVPVYDRDRGLYNSIFIENDKVRIVRASEYIETWTQYDPEVANREIYSKEGRRGLK